MIASERDETWIAEQTRRVLFLEELKKAEADGRISRSSSLAIWTAYHKIYSLCDVEVLDGQIEGTR